MINMYMIDEVAMCLPLIRGNSTRSSDKESKMMT